MRIISGRRFLFFVLVFPVQVLCAQGFVPDSTSLFDARFFKDKEAGKLINRAYHSETDDVEKRRSALHSALSLAELSHDQDAKMAGNAMLGMYEYEEGDFKEALDYFNRSLAIDSLLDPLSPVRERSLKIIAFSYSDLGAKNVAVSMMRNVLSISRQRDKKATIREYHHCTDLAGIWSSLSADSALYYFRKATGIAEKLEGSIWLSSSMNNLGYSFLESGRLDSALAVLTRAKNILQLKEKTDSIFLGSITDNIAQVLERQNRLPEALTLYSENYERFRGNDLNRFIRAGISEVRILIALGRPGPAGLRLAELNDFVQTKTREIAHTTRHKLIEVNLAYAEATGNLEDALLLTQQLRDISDSLLKIAQEKKFLAMDFLLEAKSANLKSQLQIERIARKEEQVTAQYNRLLTYGIALLAVLVVCLLILLFRRRIIRVKSLTENETILRQLAELRLTKEQLETEKLNRELELKRRDITDMAVNISARKKIAEEWLEKLKKVKASKDPEKELQALILQLKNQSQSGEEKRLLPQHVDQVNHEFYEKLKNAYPDLTRMEVDLCGMIRMRLPIKEIASIRNISSHAVRVAKHRLKKKMKLSPEKELDAFIATL
ncbi:MAG: hypothetical protein FD123_3423 [Bacteroidetes bacterium]|nr:MAG: hypothetical protein FD123_3423 [Bacteroidota bacterium]